MLFALTLGAPMSATLQVLAITPGFAPTFRILDPDGVIVLDAANPGTQTVAQAMSDFSSLGTYTIEVRSANAAAGQFLLSVQPGAPLTPPQPLPAAQPIVGVVNGTNTRQAYSFSGSSDHVLVLTVRSTSNPSAPVVALRDADTSETLALDSAGLIGVDYHVPAIPRNYLVEITLSGGDAPEPFTICLATESNSTNCSGTSEAIASPTSLPAAINPTDVCQVVSARGLGINVRGGPGTNFSIVGSLLPSSTGLVLGRLGDKSWYRVSANGVLGWVSASVVNTGGDCAGISIVAAPTPIPPAVPPANDSSSGGDNHASGDNSGAGSNTGEGGNGGDNTGGSGSAGVRQPPALNFTQAPPVAGTFLNYGAAPIYGALNLTPSFTPDPYGVDMTPGGSVDVSYLGDFCSGFATTAPDVRINISGSDKSEQGTLWFRYVAANANYVIVVRSPNGAYSCSTTRGALGMKGGINGTWYVWIAGSVANTPVSGTLEISRHSPG